MKLDKKLTIRNVSWLMLGRIVHMLLSFLIGLLTARYLGPSNYGLINYASAYTTFFTAFCTLGINSIIVKNFIDNPEEEGKTIGTTLVLRLISSVLSVFLIVGIVRIVDGDEPITLIVVVLFCISLVFQVFDTFNYWFQSKLWSKYYAIATMISYAIASVYRCVLLISGKSVEWFAIANSVDYCIVAILLYIFYKAHKGPALSFSFKKAKELLSVSCSYILSGLMIAIYGATDKLMLKQMLNESAVGYYSLAVSISLMWTFVLTSIIDSLKPTIMRYHNEDKELYEKTNRLLYAIVFYFSLVASIVISLIAPLFIEIVYGKEYLSAVYPLRIVIWYVSFAYLGVARNTWIVCEKKQKYLKYLYIGSSVLNVLLNLILIPNFGVNGAAIATVVTQLSTVFIFPLFIKDFRPNVKMLVDAIMLKGLLNFKNMKTHKTDNKGVIVTAGPTYLDIDAYACCIAMAELLRLKGVNAVAFSKAPCNYSICESIKVDNLIVTELPDNISEKNAKYIIVDVSDPDFLGDTVPLDKVIEVYDHHAGFEEYWSEKIGNGSHIEFLGAAATLVYQELEKSGLQDKMSRSTALLLIAAILDNTLNLTSNNTTKSDIEVFNKLCNKEGINDDWCAAYFSEVQKSIEADLKNALFGDIKTISNNKVLPSRIAQLCVWDADSVIAKLPDIRTMFLNDDSWMINIIDIKHQCSYFVCDNNYNQNAIEKVFDIKFKSGVAKTPVSYLRKEIIKKAIFDN